MTQNSRLVLNVFSNLKEFIGGTIQLHLQIISASLIQLYCIIFMGWGRDSQRVRLGDGEECGISPAASIHMPRKQASIIKNGSLIISIQHQGGQEDGFMHTRTHMHDNRCYSCNLKGHCENRR